MPTPPLWIETQSLSEAVTEMAELRGFTPEERRGALIFLGEVIGTGEPSYVRALERVVAAIEGNREFLAQREAENARRGAPAPSAAIGPKPATQEELPWTEK
jgi:hypothetical protein